MQIRKFIYDFLVEPQNPGAVVENDNLQAAPVLPQIIDNTPKPVYTEEEMQNAKNLARQEGVIQGNELARAEFLDAEMKKSEALAAMVKQIEEKVQETSTNTRSKLDNTAELLKLLAVAAAKKAGSADDLQKIIQEQVEKLSSKGMLKIFVNPANIDMLAGKLNNSEVVADENILNGDFKIEWDGGFAERKLEDIWQEIETILRK